MYLALDKLISYIINKGPAFIIIFIIFFLIYRYYINGKGNKSLICPSTFGLSYDDSCLKTINHKVDLNGNLINKKELIKINNNN